MKKIDSKMAAHHDALAKSHKDSKKHHEALKAHQEKKSQHHKAIAGLHRQAAKRGK